jgi:hypothetical protein
LILLLDVLEHVRAPEELLRRAGGLLTTNGRILVTTPAFNWLWTTHDDLNHHVMRYTAGGMRNTVQRAGLITTESRYLFQSLVVPKLLVRVREALTSASPQVPSIPPPPLNRAIQTWFRREYALAGWLPFGGSLLTIARRPDRRPSSPGSTT